MNEKENLQRCLLTFKPIEQPGLWPERPIREHQGVRLSGEVHDGKGWWMDGGMDEGMQQMCGTKGGSHDTSRMLLTAPTFGVEQRKSEEEEPQALRHAGRREAHADWLAGRGYILGPRRPAPVGGRLVSWKVAGVWREAGASNITPQAAVGGAHRRRSASPSSR